MQRYLFDTNIWLRAVQRESPHHSLAIHALATLLANGDGIGVTHLVRFNGDYFQTFHEIVVVAPGDVLTVSGDAV